MKKSVYLLCLIIFTCLSCIKYERGCVVKGNVTYDSTGAPAQNIRVDLILCAREAKGQSYYYTSSAASTMTDSKGYYIIYYKKLRGWKYSYYVSANSPIVPGGLGNPPSMPNKTTVDLKIK